MLHLKYVLIHQVNLVGTNWNTYIWGCQNCPYKRSARRLYFANLYPSLKWSFDEPYDSFKRRSEVAKTRSMHKRNLHRNTTDSIRTTRASQVRLDEISDKIERDKHKIIKSSHHEKVQVLNELKLIHRVFEPRLCAIKENHAYERLAKNQPASNDGYTVQNVGNRARDNHRDNADSIAYVEQPRLRRRAGTQTATPEPRRRHTEPKMWRPYGEQIPALAHSSSQADLDNPVLAARQRSHSWCQTPTNEPERSRPLAVQIEREYLAKLRNAVDKPCVSESMSSVSMGYLAFKRVLKNKRQCERLDRKFVDPRFRSVFLDVAELNVIPEQTDLIAQNDDYVHEETFSSQGNPHLVKKDNTQNSDFNGRLPTPINKQRVLSSLSWPTGDLPINWFEAPRRGLLKPDLLCAAKNTGVPRSEMSAKQRPASKIERSKTRKSSGTNMRERSNEEEEMFGTFEAFPKEKITFSSNRRNRFRGGTSKLLRPLGTGCFSESFQAL